MVKFLSQEAVLRLPGLLKGSYRPLQILKLDQEIKTKTRVAELRANVTNQIDQTEIQEIVRMKLDLDRLYSLWAEGEIR